MLVWYTLKEDKEVDKLENLGIEKESITIAH